MSIFRFSRISDISPRVSTKLMKHPMFLLMNLNIRLVLSLDDILLMVDSQKDIEFAMDTLIFLLQNLGFLIM